MSRLIAACQRLIALVRARRLDRELNDEVLAHLELAERDAMAAGATREEARQQALRQFGGIAQMREVHRDGRSARWIETFVRDLRYGLASLGRDRGFAVIAIAVLAIGIGANTAMFSLLDSVLLRPLPYDHPERIVRIWEAPTPTTTNQTTNGFFVAWRERSRSFDAMAAERPVRFNVTIGAEPVRVSGITATADYFDVFGVRALLGRTFRPGDDRVGATKVVVLSHATWRQLFGGDPNILTRDVVLDTVPYRVIGVLPPGSFDREPSRFGPGEIAAFWIPLAFSADDLTRGEHQNGVTARLRDDVTLFQAQQEMLAIRAGLADGLPAYKKAWSVTVEPFTLQLVGANLRTTIYLAFGAVALVLVITCANIANLLLARGMTRRKEMAVRAALGASRMRLLTQLLTESLALCLVGGLAGVALAYVLIPAMTPLLPPDLPSYTDLTLNLRVLAFTAAISIGAAIAVGLVPAIRTTSTTIAPTLNRATRGSSGSSERMRRAIVIAEVAISLVLICGAALLLQSLANLRRVDIGARTERVTTMAIDLPLSRYPTAAHAVQLIDAATSRMHALPGVELVSATSDLPLSGSGGESLSVAGRDGRINVRFKRVDAEYFHLLDIPVLSGRAVSRDDRPGVPPVVVINDVLAAHLAERFGMTNPLGQTVRLPALTYEQRLGSPRVDFQVIGVVRSERIRSDLRRPIDSEDAVYVSLMQFPKQELKLMARTTGEPRAAWPGLRASMQAVDPDLPVAEISTLDDVKARRSLSATAAPTWVLSTFAVVAALLTALGLYGVLSHAVTQQRREIGIRMALGATARNVLTRVAAHALAMIVAGLAIGLLAASLLTRLTAALLFDVSAVDPAAFGFAALAMALVGAIAAVVPALRAARVDPTTALRSE